MIEPWPLQILDHNDRLHHVYLEPGEALLYEAIDLFYLSGFNI